MRSLRLSFTKLRSGLPALVGVALLPACGGTTTGGECAPDDAAVEASWDVGSDLGVGFDVVLPETSPVWDSGGYLCADRGAEPVTQIVSLPAPGTPATPGQICAASPATVESNTAARVSLVSSGADSALGVVVIAPGLTPIGLPTIDVIALRPELAGATVKDIVPIKDGFRFDLKWPKPIPELSDWGVDLQFKVSLALACEGGTKNVESLTNVERCLDGTSFVWRSSGDACVECRIIAEMAPSPIVSDNQGDDLPLARVIRMRVVELARAANGVLLFAENDAGESAEYEWRVSGGQLQRLTDDLVFWTPPQGESFGQVALWNDTGAVVENFLHTQVYA